MELFTYHNESRHHNLVNSETMIGSLDKVTRYSCRPTYSTSVPPDRSERPVATALSPFNTTYAHPVKISHRQKSYTAFVDAARLEMLALLANAPWPYLR